MTRTRVKGRRPLYGDPCDGILLIDKNEGETSFDVVTMLRKTLGLKKVGHAGTLDPFATGLLIALLGQGTKLSRYLMAGEKRYLASIRLGIETDTLDPTGHVVRTKPVPELKREDIEKRILTFVGEIEQTIPAFSAVNIKGRRAYKWAREGMNLDLPKKLVIIRAVETISIEMPVVTIEVVCSGGTYIRSLATDIGNRLGTVAHLSSLRRLSNGPFHVNDAINSEEISIAGSVNIIKDNMISLKDSLPEMKEIHVDIKTAEKIRCGYRPRWNEVEGEGFIKLINEESLVAIVEVNLQSGDDTDWLRSIRVFH
jgi:tRNA pseudouridine55 synthase